MYHQGETLSLHIGELGSPLEVLIHKLQTPWTLSACIVVHTLQAPANLYLPKITFLKLFDRRYAEEYRSRWRMGPWTTDTERDLLEFSRSGEAHQFLKRWREDVDFADDANSWTAVENEACLSDKMHDIFETERDVYAALHQHQGSLIPRFYTEVTLYVGPEDGAVGNSPELFSVPGILIEHIDGFRMSDLAKHAVQADWNYLVNRAVRVTGDILIKSNILNEDFRPDNMMVCRDATGERGYRLVMIDFGRCLFREDEETDEEWGLAKHRQDEEGATGEVMKIKLKDQTGFEVDFQHPWTWSAYAGGEWWRACHHLIILFRITTRL